MNKTGKIQPARPIPQSDVGSDYYLTLGEQHSRTTRVQESSSSSTQSSFALPEEPTFDSTEPIDLSGLEIISPADWDKLKHSSSESTESNESSSSEEQGGIDIRFGMDETKE